MSQLFKKKLSNKPELKSKGTGIVALVFYQKNQQHLNYGTKNNSSTSFVKTLHYLLFLYLIYYSLHFTFWWIFFFVFFSVVFMLDMSTCTIDKGPTPTASRPWVAQPALVSGTIECPTLVGTGGSRGSTLWYIRL